MYLQFGKYVLDEDEIKEAIEYYFGMKLGIDCPSSGEIILTNNGDAVEALVPLVP